MKEIIDSAQMTSVLCQYNLLDRSNEEMIAYAASKVSLFASWVRSVAVTSLRRRSSLAWLRGKEHRRDCPALCVANPRKRGPVEHEHRTDGQENSGRSLVEALT